MVFNDIPLGLKPNRGFQHKIKLENRAKIVTTTPYRYLRRFKEEIEKLIKKHLEIDHIKRSSSPFVSSIILAKKKKLCEFALHRF